MSAASLLHYVGTMDERINNVQIFVTLLGCLPGNKFHLTQIYFTFTSL